MMNKLISGFATPSRRICLTKEHVKNKNEDIVRYKNFVAASEFSVSEISTKLVQKNRTYVEKDRM